MDDRLFFFQHVLSILILSFLYSAAACRYSLYNQNKDYLQQEHDDKHWHAPSNRHLYIRKEQE